MGNSKTTPRIQSSASRSNSAAQEDNKSACCERNVHDAASSASAEKAAEETPYRPLFANIAKYMCMNGAPHWLLACAFEVHESTIDEWLRTHKEFAAACKYGMNFADDTVERSLYQLARGYDYRDVKVFHFRGQAIYAPYMKHVVANVRACIFWLVNRRPDEWGDLAQATKKVKPNSELARAMEGMKFEFFRPKED